MTENPSPYSRPSAPDTLIARFMTWCRHVLQPVSYRETAALDLDVTGNVHVTSDRSALIFVVTGGVEHHLDVDCQYIATRRATHNAYTVRFSTEQLYAIEQSPFVREIITNLPNGDVQGRLYVCNGRVDYATLITPNGTELEWLSLPASL